MSGKKLSGRGAGGSNVQKKRVCKYKVGSSFKPCFVEEPKIAYPKKETIGKYVDLLSDVGFKIVFGKEANKDIFIAFLNAVIAEKTIVDFEYLDKEKWGIKEGSKECIYDLYCKTDDGTRIIVEIQRKPQEYFIERTLFYAQYPIQEQVTARERDYKFCPVYIVSILEFCLKELEDEGVRSHFILREKNSGTKLSEKLNVIYIELPKFTKGLDEIRGDVFGGFCYCLKHIKDLMERPVQLQQEVFKRLFEAAHIASINGLNLAEMYTERDRLGQIDYAWNEGLIKGKAEGLLEGKAEGLLEGEAIGEARGKAEEKLRILELIKQGYTAEQLVSILS